MLEIIGNLEIDFEGNIQSSKNFDSDEKAQQEIIQSSLYILHDLNSLNQRLKQGNLIKIRIRNANNHYEIAVGDKSIRIDKYKVDA